MFWLIKWAIFGLIAGAIARMVHPGRDPMNWFWTMLLGIGGAVLGGWVGDMLGFDTDRTLVSWITAVAGSIILLVAYHFATTKATPQGRVATNDEYKRAVFDDLSRGPQS